MRACMQCNASTQMRSLSSVMCSSSSHHTGAQVPRGGPGAARAGACVRLCVRLLAGVGYVHSCAATFACVEAVRCSSSAKVPQQPGGAAVGVVPLLPPRPMHHRVLPLCSLQLILIAALVGLVPKNAPVPRPEHAKSIQELQNHPQVRAHPLLELHFHRPLGLEEEESSACVCSNCCLQQQPSQGRVLLHWAHSCANA